MCRGERVDFWRSCSVQNVAIFTFLSYKGVRKGYCQKNKHFTIFGIPLYPNSFTCGALLSWNYGKSMEKGCTFKIPYKWVSFWRPELMNLPRLTCLFLSSLIVSVSAGYVTHLCHLHTLQLKSYENSNPCGFSINALHLSDETSQPCWYFN